MVKIALVGAGSFGQKHLNAVTKVKGAQLKYVVDIDESKAKKFAGQVGAEARADYKSVLSEVDAVSVVTPSPTHFEIAKECLNFGLHVFIEKPVCLRSIQVQELIKISERKKKVAQVGHIERFNHALRWLKEGCKDPVSMVARREGKFRAKKWDCGVSYDLMIHDVDLALMIGGRVTSVSSAIAAVVTSLDDVSTAILKHESGMTSVLFASRASESVFREVRLWDSTGLHTADLVKKSGSFLSKNLFSAESTEGIERKEFPESLPLNEELAAFVDSIERGNPAAVTLEDGFRSVEVIERILSAAKV